MGLYIKVPSEAGRISPSLEMSLFMRQLINIQNRNQQWQGTHQQLHCIVQTVLLQVSNLNVVDQNCLKFSVSGV